MKSLLPFAVLLCSVASFRPLSAEPGGNAPATVNPGTMSAAEISAHNRQLDRKHPDYIRCERAEATGSLVGTKRTCRTNARWGKTAQR